MYLLLFFVARGDISYPHSLLLGSPKSLIFVPILRGKLLDQALSLDQVNNQIRGAHSYAPTKPIYGQNQSYSEALCPRPIYRPIAWWAHFLP